MHRPRRWKPSVAAPPITCATTTLESVRLNVFQLGAVSKEANKCLCCGMARSSLKLLIDLLGYLQDLQAMAALQPGRTPPPDDLGALRTASHPDTRHMRTHSSGGAPPVGRQSPSAMGHWGASGRIPQERLRGLTERDHSWRDFTQQGPGGLQGLGRAPSPGVHSQQWAGLRTRSGGLTPGEEVAAILSRSESHEALAAAGQGTGAQLGVGYAAAGGSLDPGSFGLAPTAAALSANDAYQQAAVLGGGGGGREDALSPAATGSSLLTSIDSEDINSWIHAGRSGSPGQGDPKACTLESPRKHSCRTLYQSRSFVPSAPSKQAQSVLGQRCCNF